MKIIDNKGKIFGRISILDILLIITVIAMVFFAVLRLMNKDVSDLRSDKRVDKLRVVLRVDEDRGFLDAIRVNDRLGEMKKHFDVYVKEVKLEDVYTKTLDKDNKEVNTIDPSKQRALVIVEGSFPFINNSYKMGKQEIREGSTIFLESDFYRLKALVLESKVVD